MASTGHKGWCSGVSCSANSQHSSRSSSLTTTVRIQGSGSSRAGSLNGVGRHAEVGCLLVCRQGRIELPQEAQERVSHGHTGRTWDRDALSDDLSGYGIPDGPKCRVALRVH